jgi:hypothetical protein
MPPTWGMLVPLDAPIGDSMAFGMTPGPEGAGTLRRLHLQPWPVNPCSHGGLPGSLGRFSASHLALAAELVPRPPVKPVSPTAEGASRPLRQGEILMAAQVFKSSIDYSQVRVNNEEFLPFDLQPDDTAMTPNGEIYFNPKRFKEDFSLSTPGDQHWLMHEMVHVWQYQLGYPVMARGAIRIGLEYEYELDPAKKLGDYNMEAQGDLLADYWALKFKQQPQLVSMRFYQDMLWVPLYEQVLSDFLANPADERNLP